MKLRRLRIERLPGIDSGYELDALASGVNVVHGPNGSGKSSLCRAFRALVYRDEFVDGAHDLDCTVEVGGEALRVERQSNQVHWTTRAGGDAVPPRFPAHRHVGCYTIGIDDLLAVDGNEAELAERVARELAGGFDVPGVRHSPPFRLKANHGNAQAKRLRDASTKLRSKREAHALLRREADRVTVLEQDLDALQRTMARRPDYEAALGAVYERRNRRIAQGEFDAFEPYFAHLRGDEVERLDMLRAERLALEQSVQQLEVVAERAQQRATAAGYEQPTDLPDPDTLDLVRSRLTTVQEHEARMAELSVRHRAACTARVTALAALGNARLDPGGSAANDDAGQAVTLSVEAVRGAENALGAKRQHEARLRAIDAVLDGLRPMEEVRPGAPDAERELDGFRQARSALLSWLSSQPSDRPAPGAQAGRDGRSGWFGIGWRSIARWVAILGALIPLAICVAFGGWGFIALLLVPAAAVGAWIYQDRSERAAAQFAEVSFRATGVECPRWERQEVEAKLAEIDETVRNATLEIARTQRWARVQGDRRKVEDALRSETLRLEEIAHLLGFNPTLLDASFERWLRLSRDFDTAQHNVDEAAAEMAVVGERRDDLLARLTTALGGSALEYDGEEPADAAAIGHALRALERRGRDGAQAHADLQAANRERVQLEAQLRTLATQHQTLYSGVGLPLNDEAALSLGVKRMPDYLLAERALRDAEATERRAVRSVPRNTELQRLIDDDDESGLRGKLDEIGQTDAAARALIDEIAEIGARVRHAQSGHDLEEASAEHRAAHTALEEARDAADLAAVGSILLRMVEAEHVQTARPAVINEADRLFARFTKHRFGLGFRRNNGALPVGVGQRSTRPGMAEFMAVDRESGHEMPLSHLSVGTRMQLLLALRLAFAKELEGDGEPLPLFVDEALATADPERFAAVAEALGEIASSENRQVIYLTAQPYEVAQWRACATDVNVIDLALVRANASAVRRWESVTTQRRAPIPAPQGHDPEQYANVLGVPAIDPWAAVGQVHVFHLLRDDLGSVYQLLALGITSAGRLQGFITNEAGERILGSERCQRVGERVDVLRAFFEAWREGRGCPVHPADLVNAPITATFIDKVTEQVGVARGSAAALLSALDAGAVRRFSTKARAELRDWLAAEGFLDERKPLDEDARLRRVLARLTPYHRESDPEGGELGNITEVVGWLEAGVELHQEARSIGDGDSKAGQTDTASEPEEDKPPLGRASA